MTARAAAAASRSPGERGPAGFRGQVCAPRYVLDLRRERTGTARELVAPPPPDRPGPAAVLVSRAQDPELDLLSAIAARVGVPCERINADEADETVLLVDPGRGAVCVNGRWLTPTVTWFRHFAPEAIASGSSPVGELFARHSWASAVSQLAFLPAYAIGSARPGLMAQQRIARDLRIAVPRTVLATDPAAAARMIGARRLVVKAAHQHFVEADPGRLSGVFPVVATSQEVASWPAGPPVVVQEHIEHDAELRVYWAADQVLAFEVSKTSPADPWLAPHRVRVRRVDPPAAVASAAASLANALSLRYAAFDFLMRGREPFFLEANPDGDWRWAETRAGTDAVTLAAASLLCRFHRQAAAAGPSSDAGAGAGVGAGAFSLLRFLAGAHRGPRATRYSSGHE